MRGAILSNFPDYQDGRALFDLCQESFGEEASLLQQRGIYEMNRPEGNLSMARYYLRKARGLDGGNRAIMHSLAELELKIAEGSTRPLEMDAHLREAERIAKSVSGDAIRGVYGYGTLAKVKLFRLERLLEAKDNVPNEGELTDAGEGYRRNYQRGITEIPWRLSFDVYRSKDCRVASGSSTCATIIRARSQC